MRQSIWNLIEVLKRPFKYQPNLEGKFLKFTIAKKKSPPKSKKKNQNFVFFQNSHRKNYNEFQKIFFDIRLIWKWSNFVPKIMFFRPAVIPVYVSPVLPLFYVRKMAIWQPLPKGGGRGGNINFFLEAQFCLLSPDISTISVSLTVNF